MERKRTPKVVRTAMEQHRIPVVCKFYNRNSSYCRKNVNCKFMHICRRWLQTGNCDCPREHSLSKFWLNELIKCGVNVNHSNLNKCISALCDEESSNASNFANMLPQVCSGYNMGTCQQRSCLKLHVCIKVVDAFSQHDCVKNPESRCPFGRSHDLTKQKQHNQKLIDACFDISNVRACASLYAKVNVNAVVKCLDEMNDWGNTDSTPKCTQPKDERFAQPSPKVKESHPISINVHAARSSTVTDNVSKSPLQSSLLDTGIPPQSRSPRTSPVRERLYAVTDTSCIERTAKSSHRSHSVRKTNSQHSSYSSELTYESDEEFCIRAAGNLSNLNLGYEELSATNETSSSAYGLSEGLLAASFVPGIETEIGTKVLPPETPVPLVNQNVFDMKLLCPLSHSERPCRQPHCPLYKVDDVDYMWINCVRSEDNKWTWQRLTKEQSGCFEQAFCSPTNWILNKGIYFQPNGDILCTNLGFVFKRLEYEKDRSGRPMAWRWFWLDNDPLYAHGISVFPDLLEKCVLDTRASTNWVRYSKHESGFVNIDQELDERLKAGEKLLVLNRSNHDLNLKQWKQKNRLTGTKRDICRRPATMDYLGQLNRQLPNLNLDKNMISTIKHHFKQHFRYSSISVVPNENLDLKHAYCEKRREMIARLGVEKLNEVLLYHGTKWENMDKICEHNFGGSNGELAANGVCYFSPQLEYAMQFCGAVHASGSDGIVRYHRADRVVFIAFVLMGESGLGDSSFCAPPKREDSIYNYDSCVDWEVSKIGFEPPDKVAIFDNAQVYPGFRVEMRQSIPIEVSARYKRVMHLQRVERDYFSERIKETKKALAE